MAKEIANILGAKTQKQGYFEGNGYWVSYTFGHLCTLKMPDDYLSEWKSWNIHTLPIIPSRFGIKVIENSGVQKQFRVLEQLIKDCEEIINCGDAGQEGELIQRWVLLKAKAEKPMKRLWISSLTEEAIVEGFDNLKPAKEFDNLYAAGSSRAIGDWLLGINATRLFTLKFGKQGQVLSIGRVQTPTLAMIVERQKEIENFKPEKYWEIRTVYRDTNFSSRLGKIKTQEKAEEKIAALKDHPFEVTNFDKKKGKELPPNLFDLTSLQVECNKKFGFSADKTLNLIQNLYEKKLVTYPRVDTTFLPNDQYPKIPKILQGLTYYKKLTEPLLGKKIRKSKKVFNDTKVTDHHAIIPTGVSPSGITPDEQNVYDTVTRRFISVFYPDCIISRTQVDGVVDKTKFRTSGKQILDPGWRVVYDGDQQKGKEDDEIMPHFEKGESGPHEPAIDEKITRPPKYFTEASLLRAMETAGKQVDDEELRSAMKENGIGRPSTRANIIETLFKRQYIKRKKKNIHATDTGVHLIETIQNDLLKSPELTGQWENKLRQIENGDYAVDQFKDDLIGMVVDVVNEVKTGRKIKPKDPIVGTKCPKCEEGQLLKGKAAYGCSRYKEGCDYRQNFEEKENTEKAANE